ncbi:hypothetical protein ACYULU_13125 [Breznakiellaceae bacterium SP9]
MKKFVIAKDFALVLENYEPSGDYHRSACRPSIHFELPLQLSYMDLLHIIKTYTKYEGSCEWEFYPSYKEGKNLKELYEGKDFGEVKVGEIFGSYFHANMTYGPMKFEIGGRGILKYPKVYPHIYQGHGTFPKEDEFIEKKPLPDMGILYKEEHYSDFNEEIKVYFKNKYKISDEIYEETWNSNKLFKK